jgi:hypothetical protein
MATSETTLTFEDIAGFTREQLLELWKTLPAPDPSAMEGEFAPWVPPYFAEAFRGFLTSQGQDDWYGKAYSRIPHEGSQGQGHNIWQIGADVVRSLRFAWDIGPSGLDGRPALVMDYRAFDTPAAAWELVDEVRSLAPGLLLGIYSTNAPAEGFTPVLDPATGRTRHEIFGLRGPTGPWVGVDDEAAELRHA